MSHRTFARRLYLIAAATLAAVILAAAAYTVAAKANTGTPPAHHCTEDSACWNWATMGNHKRGIVTVWGDAKIVGPRGYCRELHHTPRYMRRYFIRTNRLHGDYTVIHTVCNL